MDQYLKILEIFSGDISLSQFLVTVLTLPVFKTHPIVVDTLSATRQVITAFTNNKASSETMLRWAGDTFSAVCSRELRDLGTGDEQWYFNVHRARSEQIESFQINNFTSQIEKDAPTLCSFLGQLFAAGEGQVHPPSIPVTFDATADLDQEESEFWSQVDDLEGIIEGIKGDQLSRSERLASRHHAVIKLVGVVIRVCRTSLV